MYSYPSPSGKAPNKKTKLKIGPITELCATVKDHYDTMHLHQANSPYGRNNRDVIEVVNRKYNEKLQTDLEKCEKEIQALNQKKDEISTELQQVKISENELRQENNKLQATNHELNETLQDLRFNQTGMTTYSEASHTLNQTFERQELSTMRKQIGKLTKQIANHEGLMKRELANHKRQKEVSQAEINALKFQLQEKVTEIHECEKKIKENQDMNKTITAEKLRFQELAINYEEELQAYVTKKAEIETNRCIKSAEFITKMERMSFDIEKSNEKLTYWKQTADKKANELVLLSKRLNRERAGRKEAEAAANQSRKLYRTSSMQNKDLERKNQKINEEKMGLERELIASRTMVENYEEIKAEKCDLERENLKLSHDLKLALRKKEKKNFLQKMVKNITCMKK